MGEFDRNFSESDLEKFMEAEMRRYDIEPIKESAKVYWTFYSSLVGEGFTKAQAMDILKTTIYAGFTTGTTKRK